MFAATRNCTSNASAPAAYATKASGSREPYVIPPRELLLRPGKPRPRAVLQPVCATPGRCLPPVCVFAGAVTLRFPGLVHVVA